MREKTAMFGSLLSETDKMGSLSLSFLIFKTKRAIQACFVLLHFADIVYLFFLQIESWQQPWVEQRFPSSICSLCVFVSRFAIF